MNTNQNFLLIYRPVGIFASAFGTSGWHGGGRESVTVGQVDPARPEAKFFFFDQEKMMPIVLNAKKNCTLAGLNFYIWLILDDFFFLDF
jgi:hypothetical protein